MYNQRQYSVNQGDVGRGRGGVYRHQSVISVVKKTTLRIMNLNCLTRRTGSQNVLTIVVYTVVAMVSGHFMASYLKSDIVFHVNYQDDDDVIQYSLFDKTKTTISNHLIIGVMTTPDSAHQRNILRQTWMDIDHEYLPFRVEYKFIVDNTTSKLLEENAYHKDIVFLDTAGPLSRGRRLLLWLKYAMINFRSSTLIAKMEHDVFLCTPQIYKRLKEIASDRLLYGYRHKTDAIQSLFLVFGKEIVERIALHGFCRKGRCAVKNINDVNNDGELLTGWLKLYDDVEVQWDNSKFLTTQSDSIPTMKKFCKHYLVNQLASSHTMKELWNNNKFEGRAVTGVGSVSSAVFAGNVFRSVPDITIGRHPVAIPNPGLAVRCRKWAVTTTIFNASLSVRNMVNRPEWCVVVVADTKSPPKAVYLRYLGSYTSKLVYLEPEDQDKLYPLLSRHIPWKTFGRKNIGYIFAMNHGAEFIWDFDDDNDGVVEPTILNADTVVTPCSPYTYNKINPYPFFGVKQANPWPRGFPLEDILNNTYSPKFCKQNKEGLEVSVVQSLANVQPDVDAVYRFVRETPFYFSAKITDTPLMIVPRFVYTPFNAQATLWSSKAFRYMYLPISVNGRVADIWRSYFAEYFLYKQNRLVSFAPPFVNQYRNIHNILGDFNAENDLYQKSNALIEHLSHATYNDVIDLYSDMYARGYINLKDLSVIKAWTKTLDDLNIG